MPHFNNLADAAEFLAKQTEIMDSYSRFQAKRQPWFFSPNGSLSGATSKPIHFNTWADWNQLSQNQKRFLIERAHLKETSIGPKDYDKLKHAYLFWPPRLYPVYWGGGDAEAFTCSVFVGDCMYYCGFNSNNGKYHSAKDFWMGRVNGFRLVDKDKGVRRGDVCTYKGGEHVEIVTSVDGSKSIFGNLSFCSRGAGHSTGDQGEERCGWGATADRYVNISEWKFFRLAK
ncbi:hypothetical protein [Chitinophaga qingshengii]|uniref:CHAP domain-containing protein n=1 Tax=Chitinophaga qingshengii TaxID=1569794 RepID=A0ABR7TR97_9BACT|nr:hypothetical protein [Chitinophaga qingshengii]MBC9933021.1 hypothetical protein [Chitinophaga qingshengii]